MRAVRLLGGLSHQIGKCCKVMPIGSGQDWCSDASKSVTICHAVTQWVVLPTKCTRRYRVLSVVCFHTPTVRRAAHSIADGYETTNPLDLFDAEIDRICA